MIKKNTKKEKLNRWEKWIFLVIFISILFLTAAFAAFSTTATIEGIMASVKPVGDARITNIEITSTSNNGTSNSENYNKNNIYGTINLPNQDSTVTYKVSVTVFSSNEMKIESITGLDNHLEYSLTDYQLQDVLCNTNDECNYGATADFYLTIQYKPGEYDSSNTMYPYNLTFTFSEMNFVARIGNTRYESLQAAVSAVPTNNVETTVTLLKNSSEAISVLQNQNVDFDLQNFVLSNNGVNPVIRNYGTTKIRNGIITSDTTQGVVNNERGGNMVISGGRIIATGTKQAAYNEGGTLEITGNPYLSATSTNRPVVTNTASGVLTITGGTFVSTRYSALANSSSTLTIGTKDGTTQTTPIFQGATLGIDSNTNYNFYDGIIKGKNNATNDETNIIDIETGYSILHGAEGIDGVNYKTIRLAEVVTVTFDPNGGTVDELTRELEKGTKIGTLPSPTRTDYEFQGWFTLQDGGTKITPNDIINASMPLYAHWISIYDITTAEINGVTYNTLQAAISAVPKNNTQTTITLLRNTSEAISIVARQNILFDMQNYTISNKGNNPVITNRGTLTITNGEITSNATQGAINNESNGTLIITGGRIIATGTRQAIYNNGGNLTISGTAYLSSTTSERATVQNLASGTITITGGTIISTGFNAIENPDTLTIGTKDGTINQTSPVIQGVKYGINNTGTLNYYDGIIKGKVDSINGTISDQETNSTRINATEIIDGDTYQTTHLQ